MRKLRYSISCFKNGVKNLIKWFPVIWKDRDWGEEYIYVLLLNKVNNKIKFFQSDNSYSADSDEIVEQLKAVRNALNRLVEDKYYEKACEHLGLEPYSTYENNVIGKDVFDLEDKMRLTDIEIVFSKEVSEQINGWWD